VLLDGAARHLRAKLTQQERDRLAKQLAGQMRSVGVSVQAIAQPQSVTPTQRCHALRTLARDTLAAPDDRRAKMAQLVLVGQ
jgi:hypothetical protein